MSLTQIIILLICVSLLTLLLGRVWVLLKDDDDPMGLIVIGLTFVCIILITIKTVINYPKTKVEEEFPASEYELITKITIVDNQTYTTYVLKHK